jgi:acetyl esterase
MDAEVAPTVEGIRLDFRDARGAREFTRAVLAEISSADLPGSESVRWDDRLIGSGSGRLEVRVRVYRPAAAAGRGAVLFLHGGGFILGDLEHDHAACLRLTRDIQCSVVSVDYRLAPEDPFPAAIEDCYTALMWMSDHCDELGIDPEHLAVGGSSAGGGLAASLAIMAGDRSGPPIAFQFLLYPMLDDRMDTASMAAFADIDGWNGAVTRQCWNYSLGDERPVSPYAAAARAHDLSGLPAAYVMLAQLDPLRDEGLTYAGRLMDAGVPTEVHCFPDVPHGFDIRAPDARVSRRAHEQITAAIRQALVMG